MEFIVKTSNKPVTIMINVRTKAKQKIRIVVANKYKKDTLYTNRFKTIDGNGIFYVRMPQSPETALIYVYKEGENPKSKNGFEVVDKKLLPLKSKFTVNEIQNALVKEFVEFAQGFCENAGVFSAGGSIYASDGGNFRIDYLDVITKRNDKTPLNTPARISKVTGIIELAKQRFKCYTVPMRMAILLHEFSHYYLNNKQDDEEEADYNALLIYLGLGYPRIEAERVFLKVFYKTPSDGNVERYNKINNMINNFERVGMKINKNYYYENEV